MASRSEKKRERKKERSRKRRVAKKAARMVKSAPSTVSRGHDPEAKKSKNHPRKRRSTKKRKHTSHRSAPKKTGTGKAPAKTVTTPGKPAVSSTYFFENNPGTRKNPKIVPRVKCKNMITFRCKSQNVEGDQTLDFEIKTGKNGL
jgi:hypothetical protein